MKYSITIEGETKAELGESLYVFPQIEIHSMEDIKKYCNYEEKKITAIKPKLNGNLNWNGAIKFEFLTGTDAYYSDDIADFYKEGSFRRVYYNKDDAEKESNQRMQSLIKNIKGK